MNPDPQENQTKRRIIGRGSADELFVSEGRYRRRTIANILMFRGNWKMYEMLIKTERGNNEKSVVISGK
jgi:hypothetical protein